MSWSRVYPSMEAFYSDAPTYSSGEQDSPEFIEQLEAAEQAVEALLGSDAIGDRFKDYSIAMSGHWNPEHQPRIAHGNDYISVTVTQKARTPVSIRPLGATADATGDTLTGSTQGAPIHEG